MNELTVNRINHYKRSIKEHSIMMSFCLPKGKLHNKYKSLVNTCKIKHDILVQLVKYE